MREYTINSSPAFATYIKHPPSTLLQAAAEQLDPAGFVAWPGVEVVEVTDSESDPSSSGDEEEGQDGGSSSSSEEEEEEGRATVPAAGRKRARAAA